MGSVPVVAVGDSEARERRQSERQAGRAKVGREAEARVLWSARDVLVAPVGCMQGRQAGFEGVKGVSERARRERTDQTRPKAPMPGRIAVKKIAVKSQSTSRFRGKSASGKVAGRTDGVAA